MSTPLDLQKAERSEHGDPLSFHTALRERALADSLRSDVIAFMAMRQNEITTYFGNDQVALNADMGPNHTELFKDFEDRLAHICHRQLQA